MYEFKIITGSATIVECTLNRWYKNFFIEVLKMTCTPDGMLYLLIKRNPKPKIK